MKEAGFRVQTENIENLSAIKAAYSVPFELQSCHTAIVDGYVIEGHVPVEEVNRLLTERPDILGIGVAGMPQGSPGMESPDGTVVPFDVIAFNESGVIGVFASYP